MSRKAIYHRSKGQDMVEYALLLPVFLLMIFGIMEFGMAVFVWLWQRAAAGQVSAAEYAAHCR